jgi:dipeptidase E
MKRLFLASAATNPTSLEKLKKFVSGFTDKKIVYIPTASNGSRPGGWKKSVSFQTVSKIGADIKVVELESCVRQDIYQQINGADILWVGGGQTGYLLYWFHRSELFGKLESLLAKGLVYVGSSGGSMACSKTQHAAELYIGAEEPGAALIPGFGLLDFEVYPHFKDIFLPKIRKVWRREYGKLCLLKDGEAIAIEGDEIRFFGKGRFLNNG